MEKVILKKQVKTEREQYIIPDGQSPRSNEEVVGYAFVIPGLRYGDPRPQYLVKEEFLYKLFPTREEAMKVATPHGETCFS